MLLDRTAAALFSEEDKIRLIHECPTAFLNRMFDDFSRLSDFGAEELSDEIVATAQAIRSALWESDAIGSGWDLSDYHPLEC